MLKKDAQSLHRMVQAGYESFCRQYTAPEAEKSCYIFGVTGHISRECTKEEVAKSATSAATVPVLLGTVLRLASKAYMVAGGVPPRWYTPGSTFAQAFAGRENS